ncbi:MAG: ABC transporter permease [Flavipsychrobacter sp.]|nr:ABC transporter permease [Flavipsychrobacter sp.]
MKKIVATIIKEWILLRRDLGGLMLLLIMPAVLIMVMAMVQDAPFKDYQQIRFELLLADNDGGMLAEEIKKGLRNSRNFQLVDSLEGKPLTEEKLKTLLENGTYTVGIVIPSGATAEIVNSANSVANNISQKLGLGGTLPTREPRNNMDVALYFDPVSKPTFRTSIRFALDKYITASGSKMLVERITRLSKIADDTAASQQDVARLFQGIGIREAELNPKDTDMRHINSVQHNVPAWAIFGMFFIIIPLAGQLIRERDERSALRVLLIPNAHRMVSVGKISFYTLICTVQFYIMFAIGYWAMPGLGLPSIYLGQHPMVLLPVALAIGFAATSYGYFVGTVFKTANQALSFGSISVVILSAMGGIWVPVELLSPVMQKISLLSPLHWALDAVHQVILRDRGIEAVLPNLAVLWAFGFALWCIAIFRNNARSQSIQ